MGKLLAAPALNSSYAGCATFGWQHTTLLPVHDACHCLRLRSCFGGVRRFPLESSALAPGMCAEVDVCFTPDSLGDYEDAFAVETPAGRFEVQLTGRRPHPDLTLPPVLEVRLHKHDTATRWWAVVPPYSCSSCEACSAGCCSGHYRDSCASSICQSGLHSNSTATAGWRSGLRVTDLAVATIDNLLLPAAATGWQRASRQQPLQDL
jgi:hypothetical protein